MGSAIHILACTVVDILKIINNFVIEQYKKIIISNNMPTGFDANVHLYLILLIHNKTYHNISFSPEEGTVLHEK